MNYDEILDYKYIFEDADADCLRDYFYTLVHTLWCEGEGFSGKRPFGNSGWEYDIYNALVTMGAVKGKFEYDEGEPCGLMDFDKVVADNLVPKLIAHCFYGDK